MKDLNDYIGVKWAPNGYGPNSFDCWGLVVDVYKNCLDTTLPSFDVHPFNARNVCSVIEAGRDALVDSGEIVEVKEPKTWDIVMLERGSLCNHVGIYISGQVLHVSETSRGCVLERFESFAKLGTGHKFYRREVS